MHLSEFDYNRHEIERALFFLSNALQDSGHKTKPVLIHSFEVAEMLWERGLPQEVVVAGALHDVVEDTAVTIEDVTIHFGEKVALYVDALTLSESQNIDESFKRCAELGSDVLSIRAADLIKNSYYYHLASREMQKTLKEKYTRFLNMYGEQITESLRGKLYEIYELNVKSL